MADTNWDCVVVGGGAAGLSAALVLGRARRKTLVVDADRQSNRPAHAVGGLLGHDGRAPADLYRLGREELARYPSATVRTGAVSAGRRLADRFALEVAGAGEARARRVLLAMGMDYEAPEVPGLDPLWGGSVFHCPFCHGWEVRDRALAVLGGGSGGVHRALLLRYWSEDVVLLTDGEAELDGSSRSRLRAAAVEVDDRPVAELLAEGGSLSAVRFEDGGRLERDGLLVAAPMRQRSDLAAQLGAKTASPTPMAADPLEVDAMGRTTAEGVFAAGDLAGALAQVSAAIASGAAAAAAIVQSLLAEDHDLPIPPAPKG